MRNTGWPAGTLKWGTPTAVRAFSRSLAPSFRERPRFEWSTVIGVVRPVRTPSDDPGGDEPCVPEVLDRGGGATPRMMRLTPHLSGRGGVRAGRPD